MTEDTPPTFLVHTHEDGLSPNHSVLFYQALLAKRVQAELHVFGRGPHGTGLAPGDPDLGKWPTLLENWLRRNGLLTSAERHAIKGRVTIRGNPLFWGWVTFTPDDPTKPHANAYMGWNDEGKFTLPAESAPCLGKHRVEVHLVSRSFEEKKTGTYSMRDSRKFAKNRRGAPLVIEITEANRQELHIDVGRPESTRNAPPYPPEFPDAEDKIYKVIGDDDVALNAYVFNPPNHRASDRRPTVVFFFGGGWRAGSPAQFAPHCRYFAERGMVAIAADYRVADRHDSKAIDSVRDAQSAVRWARQKASELGIDPNRIVASGGSAGGHLAACTGLIDALDEDTQDAEVSSTPNALALFNPAVVFEPVDGEVFISKERLAELRTRFGAPIQSISPFHHIRSDLPPTIIFHGKADTTVSYRSVERFTEAMQRAGNRCELLGYEDQGHGFFNADRDDGKHFTETVTAMDQFLVSLGYLDTSISAKAQKLLQQP